MIELHELNRNNFPTNNIIDENLNILLEKINKIRSLWAKPMTVTSGLRSMEDHLRIYREKGITDPKQIPMASGHLNGECADIFDPDGDLREWCLKNLSTIKEIGLWMEDFRYTKGWVHFGIKAPKSGNRIFIPSPGPIPHPELWDGSYDREQD